MNSFVNRCVLVYFYVFLQHDGTLQTKSAGHPASECRMPPVAAVGPPFSSAWPLAWTKKTPLLTTRVRTTCNRLICPYATV